MAKSRAAKPEAPTSITALSVKGFKSLVEEQTIEICPLTLLAGANSSGKSSALQPLLLLKQTLDATYDPGSLLLDGPHVRFTSVEQLLSRIDEPESAGEFSVSLTDSERGQVTSVFRQSGKALDLVSMIVKMDSLRGEKVELNLSMSSDDLRDALAPGWGSLAGDQFVLSLLRNRCFFEVVMSPIGGGSRLASFSFTPEGLFPELIGACIHVPGLRGNPERAYKTTAVTRKFPGTFENYVASIIVSWQQSRDVRLDLLGRSLEALGLSWTVQAQPINAVEIELQVGRLPGKGHRRKDDLVNIADVGFGVSQVLPVLVALLTAKPGQLVHIEQPELHLHPRAQQALASILAEAADRGARVVVETHSSILLLALQTLVAEGKLSPDKVKLHWFQRDSRGATKVTSGELDTLGAYGDWPEDFGEVIAGAEDRYLSAVETKALPRRRKNAKR